MLSDGTSKIALCGVNVLAIGKRIADDIRDASPRKNDIAADTI